MSDDKKYQLSRRKALLGLGTIGVAGAAAGMGTSALFNDTESFEENSITAGTSNLKVTMGLVSATNPGLMDINYDVGQVETADGDVGLEITVGDIKPGDCLTLRYTVDVIDNPMYVAAKATGLDDAENGESDPESTGSGPDTDSDAIGDGNGDDAGDLDNEMDVRLGWDSDRGNLHDNSLEGSIDGPEFSGSATDFLANYLGGGVLYRGRNGAAPAPGPGGAPPGGHGPAGGDPTRIGDDTTASNVDRDKVTHFVELCLPKDVGNNVQGDSFSWTLEFAGEQVRNNSVSSSDDVFDGVP